MLIGYMSDENYSAIPDALVELEQNGESVAVIRSSPRGALHADVPAGEYKITLSKPGFGSKHVIARLDLKGPYQFRLLSDTLLGYAWPKWTKSGEQCEFRIHAVESCRLTLWRYGQTKEFVRMVGWFDEHAPRAVMQITPDGDYSQTGVYWNQTGYPKNFPGQLITAPDRSGLYYFHAETDSRFFSFPWVVAPASPQSEIAVLASTNTWNSYNNFGGRSNYINSNGLPAQPTVNSRQDLSRYTGELTSVWQFRNEEYPPLSFDRPEPFNSIRKDTELTDPIRGRQACHLAETEWRMMGWLEREGFDYDVYSDYQLHEGTLDLDAYKILIITTHPEYWTREQYFRVKKWVFERGGKLMYLGGNGIDCEIDYPDPTLMHHNNWAPNPNNPGNPYTDPDTGQVVECRFHYTVGESPAALLGVVFSEPGIGTGAPYRVTDASSWIFHGTGLKDGDVFGTSSLHERSHGGASGHETDKRSGSSPAGTVFVARGMNADDGGAEIGYHETGSGGSVFSVGSITWPACVLVDDAVSRITRNVIERFGVKST